MDWLVLVLAIITHESRGNLNVPDGKHNDVGICQIREICVEDYNKIYSTNYTHDDMRKPKIAIKVCQGYLRHWGKHYKTKTGKEPTYEVYARIWNGGPSGWNRDSTKKYWKKVQPMVKHWKAIDKKDQLLAYISLTKHP